MRAVSGESDERLFAAYVAGDVAAHEALFRRYQERLRRYLERMLGERAAAEGVTIETFLRLHRHRRRFRAGTSVRAWIFTIGRNLARNRLRAQRLWGWFPLSSADAATTAPPPESTGEVRERVAAAFAALPAVQREVCALRLVAGLSLEEIAATTGASIGTVKSRLFYGLRRLRALLGDLAPGGTSG
ncbi:MAG TPA: sigma-70 family RNA polymerase sigma factor [Candidatus Eisenbacteria bacterium]|nr:sigma-70 family RNA polymerase sigma factor [Candidatus Eisenbacteria bacterium]